MASLKEDVNAAFQRITNNPYAYVSHPEVLALIEALSTVSAGLTEALPPIAGVVIPNPATVTSTEETK